MNACAFAMAGILVVLPATGTGQGPVEAGSDAEPIEQVIVTAQRRTADAQDVPISMTVLGSEFIESREIATLTELSGYVPNLTLNSSSQEQNTRILIRGVGSVGNNAIESSVGVFIDGVYYPKPGSVVGELIDVRQIEVLRGPQGTNFGRNTPVGALNIVTADPSSESTAEIFAEIGNYRQRVLGGVIGGALTDRIDVRLGLRASDRGGYGTNGYTGKRVGYAESVGTRGKLGLDLGARLKLVLAGDIAQRESGGPTVEILNRTSTTPFVTTLESLFGSSPVTKDSFDHALFQDHIDMLDDEQWGLSATVDYELANGMTLTSITALRDWDSTSRDSTLRVTADLLPQTSRYTTQTRSEEIHLKSAPGARREYLAGLFVYDEDYGIDSGFDAGIDFCEPVIFALTLEQTGNPLIARAQAQSCLAQPQQEFIRSLFFQTLESAAVFGSVTFGIGDRASFGLGGRWTDDNKDADSYQLVSNTFGFLFRQPEATPGLQRDDSKLTWSMSGSYRVSGPTMLFATLATGFKSGGFNSQGGPKPLGAAGRTFAPEDSTSLDLGVKSTLLDGRLQADVTLFRTEIDAFQDRNFDGLSFLISNAGKVRQQGLEADIVYAPVRSILLRAGLGRLDSEFLSYPSGPPLPGSPTPQDLTGRSMHYSPEWTASLAGEWRRASRLLSGTDWVMRTDLQYVGEQNLGSSTNDNPQSIQQGYSLANLSIGLDAADGRWSAKLYGKNVGNQGYCMIIFDQPVGSNLGAVDAAAGTSVQRCVLGAPATYGAAYRRRF